MLLVTLELSRNSRDVRVGVFFFLVNWGKNDLKIAFFTFWQKKKKKKKKKKGGGGAVGGKRATEQILLISYCTSTQVLLFFYTGIYF